MTHPTQAPHGDNTEELLRSLSISRLGTTSLRESLVGFCEKISVIPNIDRASEIILSAALDRRRILVFGDYDADGVCSVAAMVRLLRFMGADPMIMLPNRMTDGHGVSPTASDKIVGLAPEVLIVLDCGTTASRQFAVIAETVGTILVIDHHSAPPADTPPMPANTVLVNPAILPETEDARRLFGISSAGVLTYLTILRTVRSWRARGDFPEVEAVRSLLNQCLALGALTAVADMVPMMGINRAMVQAGLKHARSLPGLWAIGGAMKYKITPENITVGDVGFKYGPTINAAGRIADGGLALDLMISDEPVDVLAKGAAQVVGLNEQRREITADVIDACLGDAGADCGSLIVNDDFHQGVVGLAASRLLETTRRPAIVVGTNGAGSARSVPGFHIGNFVGEQVAAGNLLKGGGHAGAAGFTVIPERLDAFRAAFEEATKGVVRKDREPDITITSSGQIDIRTIHDSLAPFGMGNPDLLLHLVAPKISGQRWFGGENRNSHMSFKVEIGREIVDCIVFYAAGKPWTPAPGNMFAPGGIQSMTGTLRVEYDNYHKEMRMKFSVSDMVAPGKTTLPLAAAPA